MERIVLDAETQKDFSQVGGRDKHHLLRVSVVGAYSYKQDKFFTFEETNLAELEAMLAEASQVIGFNINQFDYPVLQPYMQLKLRSLPTIDILQEVEKALGHRISLDTLAQASLKTGKSGTGLAALALFREGRMDELKQYCLDDVRLTRDLYEYGRREGKLLFQDFFEVKEIPITFPDPVPRERSQLQRALF